MGTKPNPFLERQKQEKLACIRAGMDTSWQEFWDLLCITLNDPEVMGKDTFGKGRLLKLRAAIEERETIYSKGLNSGPEADYYQEKLDTALRKIFGPELAPFKARYPYIPQLGYTKANKRWRQD